MSDDHSDDDSDFSLEAWAKKYHLNKTTRGKLQRGDYNDKYSLSALSEKDLTELKLTPHQLYAVREGIAALRQQLAASRTSPPRDHLATLMASAHDAADSDDGDAAAQQTTHVTRNASAAFDPRAILIVKARTRKAVHITEFLTDTVK
jgi:hypothetical protein